MNTYVLINNCLQVLEGSIKSFLTVWNYILCFLQQKILFLYVVNILTWKTMRYIELKSR